jgi:glycosyltransferase involved in cell wall biosynthesis
MANLSDNIENTFDWSNYLSEKLKVYDYVAKFEQDGFEKSAIKKGFSPIFSKENMLEAVGLRENYLSMYPIDAISKAGNYLRKNNVHGFPESALSQKGEMWVDVPYKGELGINHPSNALQLIYDWTPEQVLALKKKIRDDSHLKAILNSNLFKNAVTDSSGGLTFTEGALLYKKISDFADAKDVIAPEATRGQVPKANAKEAMSAGLPVVATKLEGIGQIVEEAVTGYLTEVANADALAVAIGQTLEHPERRERMSLAAYEKAKKQFSSGERVKMFEDLCREVVEGKLKK